MSSLESKAVIDLERKRDGNKLCAECRNSQVTHVSLSLGVFVCKKCAQFHKCLPADRNNTVLILSHEWTEHQVTFIKTRGNISVNEDFEKHLPNYYHRPDSEDPPILREQFIRAKYEREEFKEISQQSSYNQGSKTGSLLKRGKDSDKYLRRKFIIKEPEGNLQYYIKYSDTVPKDNIAVRNLVNVFMVPDKMELSNGMQITYEREGTRRNLFVVGETGKDTSDWYHAIRAAMVRHKFRKFPDEEMMRYLNTKIIMEGWMSKTGPKRLEKFRKRWFTLVGTMIWYYAQPLDAHPLGSIPLGSKTFGYGVKNAFPADIKTAGYGLTIHTPDRVFVLKCADKTSHEKWFRDITQVINTYSAYSNRAEIEEINRQGNNKEFSEKTSDENNKAAGFIDLTLKYTPLPADSDGNSQKSNDTNAVARTPLFKKNSNRPRNDKIKARHGSLKPLKSDTSKYHSINDVEDHNINEAAVNVIKTDANEMSSGIIANYNCAEVISEADNQSEEDQERYGDSTTAPSPALALNSDEYNATTIKNDDIYGGVNAIKISVNELSRGITANHDSVEVVFESDGESEKDQAISKDLTTMSLPVSGSNSNEDVVTILQKTPPTNRGTEEAYTKVLTRSPFQAEKNWHQAHLEDLDLNELVFVSNRISQSESSVTPDEGISPTLLEKVDLHETDNSDFDRLYSTDNTASLSSSEDTNNWREQTSHLIRRVTGRERKSIAKASHGNTATSSKAVTSIKKLESKVLNPKPIDVTLSNNINEGIWFLVFQSELLPDQFESYVTPWVGAQIAETPASVGPITIPSDFEIAVIDKAPGGFGLLRTTGPFYAESGDVWEVDIPNDDGSAPDLYYHEGMESGNGSVMLYANAKNIKKFEIAVFKGGKKLFSRRGVKPGESVNIQVKPAIYFLSVDQETFYDLEGQDIRASEYITKATCIDINYHHSRMKVVAKKAGEHVYFTWLVYQQCSTKKYPEINSNLAFENVTAQYLQHLSLLLQLILV